MLGCSPWALLPPLFSGLTAAGLWLVYFVALHNKKILPLGAVYRRNGSVYPPFISLAGNDPPASCIFSEVMNLAAFFGFLIAVLRYLQLKQKVNRKLNTISLVAFSLGCFGMTLVGNFQLFADMVIHNLGTFMTFGLGTLYCWIQSFITQRVNLNNEGRKTGIVRFLLSGIITFCFILHISLVPQGLIMQAAQSQWALVMFFLIFLSTFAIEFRLYRFDLSSSDYHRHPESRSAVLTEPSTYQPNQM